MNCTYDSNPATVAIDLGQLWADGRKRYQYTCAGCAREVVKYQESQGRVAPTLPIQETDQVGMCAACWASHGCDLPDDHDGDHVCGSLDPDGVCGSPSDYRDDIEIFHIRTFTPCARTGGVKQ